ncbi:ribosomal protein L7/L12 [Streptomyces sp. NPDC056708]|uniref:ribosomal protein L7/L12 n=2 Tax=unclassified Streptomyces TaxID=2593676 RepID=UPI0036911FFE
MTIRSGGGDGLPPKADEPNSDVATPVAASVRSTMGFPSIVHGSRAGVAFRARPPDFTWASHHTLRGRVQKVTLQSLKRPSGWRPRSPTHGTERRASSDTSADSICSTATSPRGRAEGDKPVALHQAVIDALGSVPLFGRSVQVSPQHAVDQRLVGIEPGLLAPLLLPRLRPLAQVVRRMTGLSLWRSKVLVDQAPVVILDRIPEETAERAVAALRDAGEQAELRQQPEPHSPGPVA